MNPSFLFNIILIGITVFMFYRIIMLWGRSKYNKKMLAILDQIDDKDAFFKAADAFINEEKDAEYVQKVSVLRLWGDTFYERDEEFKAHLEELNIDTLLNPTGKKQTKGANEDSFFYLYVAIPNRLHYRKRKDLRRLLDEKLAPYAEANQDLLLREIYDQNKKFYDGTEDRGIEFMKKLMDGEYSGYAYSKQLIGLYKHCEEALLATHYRSEGNTEAFEECLSDLDNFGRNTRLGARWLKECHITLPKEEEDEEKTEEAEASEAENEAASEETVEKEANDA